MGQKGKKNKFRQFLTSFEKKFATVVLSQDFPGQKEFVLGFLDLSWDKGTAGQGTFFCSRTNGRPAGHPDLGKL